MFNRLLVAMANRGARGAVASEYAILLALIAVVMVTAVTGLEGAITGAITDAANEIKGTGGTP